MEFLILHVLMFAFVQSYTLNDESLSLLTSHEFFEVAGEMTPVTLFIQKILLHESIELDFEKWICPSGVALCVSQTPRQNQNQDGKSRKRAKRFIGAALALFFGLRNKWNIDEVRDEITSKMRLLQTSVDTLKTGVHELGDTIIHHIQIDSQWKKHFTDFLINQTGIQHDFNDEVIRSLTQLWNHQNILRNTTDHYLASLSLSLRHLTRATGTGLLSLASEVSTINTLLDTMVWGSLEKGLLPLWALAVPSIKKEIISLAREIPGYSDPDGVEFFKQVIAASYWFPIAITPGGTLFGTLLPNRDNFGTLQYIQIPPVCIPGDDGHYYLTQTNTMLSKIEYQGTVYYKGREFSESCEKGQGISLCQHPQAVTTSIETFNCAQSVFDGSKEPNCVLKLAECPKRFMIHKTRGSLIVSGDLVIEQSNKPVTRTHGAVALVIPFSSDDNVNISLFNGQHLLTVRKGVSKRATPIAPIKLVGDWSLQPVIRGLNQPFGQPKFIQLPRMDPKVLANEGINVQRIGDSLQLLDEKLDSSRVEIDSTRWLKSDIIGIIALVLGSLGVTLIGMVTLRRTINQYCKPSKPRM